MFKQIKSIDKKIESKYICSHEFPSPDAYLQFKKGTRTILKNGTIFNETSKAYEQNTELIQNLKKEGIYFCAGYISQFKNEHNKNEPIDLFKIIKNTFKTVMHDAEIQATKTAMRELYNEKLQYSRI